MAANPRVSGIKRKGMASAASTTASGSSALNTATASQSLHTHSILPEDSGIIRCVCTLEADDGFTIQCERCYAWLHGSCVGFTPEEEERGALPEVYICPLCENGGKVDPAWRARATKAQRARLALAASMAASAASAGVAVDAQGGYPVSSMMQLDPIEGGYHRASPSSALSALTRLESIDPTGTLVIPLPSSTAAAAASQSSRSRRTKGSNTISTSRATVTGRTSLSPGTATAAAAGGNLPGLATWSNSAGSPSHGMNEAFSSQEHCNNYNSVDPSLYRPQPVQQQQQQRGKRQSSASSAKGQGQGHNRAQGSKSRSPFQSTYAQTQNATGASTGVEYEGALPYSATTASAANTSVLSSHGQGAGGEREKVRNRLLFITGSAHVDYRMYKY